MGIKKNIHGNTGSFCVCVIYNYEIIYKLLEFMFMLFV